MTANQSTSLPAFDPPGNWDLPDAVNLLTMAADRFVKSVDGWTEIWAASRDWFLEQWGRDAFIALPGLLLVTGRFDEARSVFLHFAQSLQHGLIPNRIQQGTATFNSVDGSLWYLQALQKYLQSTGDFELLEPLSAAILQIVESFRSGTSCDHEGRSFKIVMDADALISSPPQATWMDADPSERGQACVTPRNGKAVEINALWYANLRWLQQITTRHQRRCCELRRALARYGLTVDVLAGLADQVKQSFNAKFWNDRQNCLMDVVDGDPHGHAVRPNQIIAISHGGDLLTQQRKRAVFDVVTANLLTPGGLRTLSPRDPKYRGDYDTYAPISEKDWAYHQGTVWPWLIGPYGDAFMQIKRDPKGLQRILGPLVEFAFHSEYRSLPEVFSGDPPHEPGGTTSQAWSVAEVLRLLCEHLSDRS